MNALDIRRTLILNNKELSDKLTKMVSDKDFKLLCACAITSVGRLENGNQLIDGANALVDCLLSFPIPDTSPDKVDLGLKYT